MLMLSPLLQQLPAYHYYRMLKDRHYKPPPPLQFEDEVHFSGSSHEMLQLTWLCRATLRSVQLIRKKRPKMSGTKSEPSSVNWRIKDWSVCCGAAHRPERTLVI